MLNRFLKFFGLKDHGKIEVAGNHYPKKMEKSNPHLERLETREVPAGLTFNTGQLVINMRDMGTTTLHVGSVDGLLQINGAVASIHKGQLGKLMVNKVTKIVVHGTEGNDTIDLRGMSKATGFLPLDNKVEIYAGKGNDTAYGSTFGDLIHGNEGNDLIFAGFGNDRVFGLSGNDSLYGESGDDFLEGGDGDDKLFGGIGNDKLHGLAGMDFFDGGSGLDTGRPDGVDKKAKNSWWINMEGTY